MGRANRDHWDGSDDETAPATDEGTTEAPVLAAARAYTRRGWAVIPLAPGTKRPLWDDWRHRRLAEAALAQELVGARNVGLLTGAASGGLVDVDCDVPEAVAAAAALLPPTSLVHGRPGKLASRYWYVVDDLTPPTPLSREASGEDGHSPLPVGEGLGVRFLRTTKFAFVEQDAHAPTMLVELRGDGCQTMVPPARHPCGERLRWERKGQPGRVAEAALRRAVGQVAACGLLARHWPREGQRDEAALALCGLLLGCGRWTAEEADRFVRLVARLAADEEWRQRGKGRQTAEKLEAGQPVMGGTALAARLRGDGARVVAQVAAWLELAEAGGGGGGAPGSPDALSSLSSLSSLLSQSDARDIPLALHPDASYGLAGELVRAIEPHTEADPAALLIQFLAAFGNLVGRRAYFQAEQDLHYPNLFVVLVGQTAKGRKGTSWGQAVRLFNLCPSAGDWLGGHVTSGLSSGEGLIHLLRDRLSGAAGSDDEGDDPPLGAWSGAPDPADPLGLKKRLLVRESEFAAVLKMFMREGNTLSAVLRQAWDGDTLGVITKKDRARASGAHVSVIGHITREELVRYLSQTEAANGLGNRFLWLCVRRSKLLPDGGALDAVDLGPLRDCLESALAFVATLAHHRLTRDPQARTLWHAVYPRLSEGSPGLVGALTARAEAQVMQLACVYALLDCARVIRVEHLRAALAVWDYAEASVRAIFGPALGDTTADAILRVLRATPAGLSRTDLFALFGRHTSAAELARALGMLRSASCATAGWHTCGWSQRAGGPSSAGAPSPLGESGGRKRHLLRCTAKKAKKAKKARKGTTGEEQGGAGAGRGRPPGSVHSWPMDPSPPRRSNARHGQRG
jgi:Bifunctional DNA primase/polymerase, N-terminal